jgi:hypothetical protein
VTFQRVPGSGSPAKSAALLQLDPSTRVTREVVRRTIDFRFYDPSHYDDVEPRKLFLEHWNDYLSNNYCEADDGWLEPEFPGAARASRSPGGGTTVDPYNLGQDIPKGTCDSISRS